MIKNLSITVTSRKEKIIWELRAYLGKIIIGNFTETIYIPVEFWTLEDYKKQWKEGLRRIETEKKSCLVATVQGYDNTVSLINWWPLYKVDDKIIVENCLLVGKYLTKTLDNRPFTPETCYDFIPGKSRSKEVSKWIIDLKEK